MPLWTKYHKDGNQIINGWVCDSCDGWNNRITKYCPNCGEPMKAAISVPTLTSVDDFIDASDHTDWIGMLTDDVYKIYCDWCDKNELKPSHKISFVRKILDRFGDLKSSPMKGKRYFRER